jgi:hypothetical protein
MWLHMPESREYQSKSFGRLALLETSFWHYRVAVSA